MIEFTDQDVEKYSKSTVSGTGFLAYRDVEKLLSKLNLKPKRALDLGCGSGRSIGVIKDLCDSVTGCDISELALKNTHKSHPDVEVFLNDLSSKQYPSAKFDSIFSFLMFCHVDSLQSMSQELERCYNSLNEGGFLLIVKPNRAVAVADFSSVQGVGTPPELEGDCFNVHLKNVDLVVEDVYWKPETIQQECEKLGFSYLALHQPLGEIADNQPYRDEYHESPYFYLVMQK
ncbi:class I SAM-dependent methyltransferase [Vibrio marisflavi]|uniref:Methyltransferase type 11 domain-containing protein n=1 Tax=Vibrio marisflavi CECT 7928 TaxID=634439 RepID=A0ABM9A1S7_9VIBR|nr:class I SAM-dependent methyltransferase [Vibrio marisflavi]CAH0537768.1 hypothetical protein VMF7928_01321 [Vibrio marisflavi CECT 7928]